MRFIVQYIGRPQNEMDEIKSIPDFESIVRRCVVLLSTSWAIVYEVNVANYACAWSSA